jgi:hypothetical protein
MAPHPITQIVDGISRLPPPHDAARPTISAGDRDAAGPRASRSLARVGLCGASRSDYLRVDNGLIRCAHTPTSSPAQVPRPPLIANVLRGRVSDWSL